MNYSLFDSRLESSHPWLRLKILPPLLFVYVKLCVHKLKSLHNIAAIRLLREPSVGVTTGGPIFGRIHEWYAMTPKTSLSCLPILRYIYIYMIQTSKYS